MKSKLLAKFRSPYVIFLFCYTAYNLSGLVNFGIYYSNDFDVSIPWSLFLIGLLGYIIAYLFAFFIKKTSKTSKTKKMYFVILKPYYPKIILPAFFIFSLLILLILFIKSGGVPLFMGEKRFSLPPIFFNSYRIFEYLFLFYYIHEKLYKKKVGKLWMFAFFLFLLFSLGTGYRTQVVEALLFLLFFEFFAYNLSFLTLLRIMVILLIFSSFVALYRVEIDYDAIKFFKNVNISFFEKHQYLLPILPFFSLMRYSQYTVYKIYSNLSDNYFWGYLAISNFITLLPGEQPGMRNIVGEIVGARIVDGKYMSHTPTLQGAFYIDFGFIGVFLMFFFLGLFLSLFDVRKYIQTKDSFRIYLYMYFYTYTCLSIHVGYWDIILLVFLLSSLIIALSIRRRNFLLKSGTNKGEKICEYY